jgi:hypothetical protein
VRASPRLTAATLGLVLLVAACGSSAAAPTVSPVPVASPSAVADVPSTPSASPDVIPSPATDPSPSTDPEPEPTSQPTKAPARPAPTVAPAKPEPTEAPAVTFTDAEQRLVDRLRVNAAQDCAPRRSDLPPGATAGIECQVGTNVVDRVGAYQFPNDDVALDAYVQRLEANGVLIRTAGCEDGKPGDQAWTPGDDDGRPLVPFRYGCFVDEDGMANERVLCGGGRYIGIVGASADIRALARWVGEPDENYIADTPAPPAICHGPQGM